MLIVVTCRTRCSCLTVVKRRGAPACSCMTSIAIVCRNEMCGGLSFGRGAGAVVAGETGARSGSMIKIHLRPWCRTRRMAKIATVCRGEMVIAPALGLDAVVAGEAGARHLGMINLVGSHLPTRCRRMTRIASIGGSYMSVAFSVRRRGRSVVTRKAGT